jgi:carbohydrate-selective porin OprB
LVAGLAYLNAYSADGRLDTFTGSNNADTSGGFNERSAIHAINGTLQWRLARNVTFGAWGGLIGTDSLPSDAFAVSTTYQASLGFSDPFGRKGDLLAFLVGQPPKLNVGGLIERADEGRSLHYEAFYRFRVSDRVSVTPGFFVVTDPGHIKENKNIFVGTLRTTFNF